MTVIIFGKDGQIGRELQKVFQEQDNIIYLGRQDCDLSNMDALQDVLKQYQPQIIINASAYTAVDRAQDEQGLAFAINATAPEIMAKFIASQSNGLLIHYSTDYVFGDRKRTPYQEDDETGPETQLGIYGQSKLAGERAIIDAFEAPRLTSASSAYYILRTSWVYGDGGNFIKTMLRLAEERDRLSVVADQVGAPTSALFLASLAKTLLVNHQQSPRSSQFGIYHAVPHGHTSWYSLAQFVIELIQHMKIPVRVTLENVLPIPATDYPLPAPRPYNSRLCNKKLANYLSVINAENPSPLQLQHWQKDVVAYVHQCAELIKQ
jgi:dTDP-4-dehydrorhamnose reductase